MDRKKKKEVKVTEKKEASKKDREKGIRQAWRIQDKLSYFVIFFHCYIEENNLKPR